MMRSLLPLLAFLLLCEAASPCSAQAYDAPVYSRQRAEERTGRGYDRANYQGRYAAGYLPYFQPFVAGSWYARPYPYHFDYYRQRYSSPLPTAPCPCAQAPRSY